jgi:malate dehydrogenase
MKVYCRSRKCRTADVISYDASEVTLLDIKGLCRRALDIMQCATNTGFNTRVSGVTNDYTKTADVMW